MEWKNVKNSNVFLYTAQQKLIFNATLKKTDFIYDTKPII